MESRIVRIIASSLVILASLPILWWGLVVNGWDDAGTGGNQLVVLGAILLATGLFVLAYPLLQRRMNPGE